MVSKRSGREKDSGNSRVYVENVLERLYKVLVSRIVLDRANRLIEAPLVVEAVANMVEEVLGVETEYFDCGDPVEDHGIVGYITTKDGVRIVMWQSVFENEPTSNTIIRLFDNDEEMKNYLRRLCRG